MFRFAWLYTLLLLAVAGHAQSGNLYLRDVRTWSTWGVKMSAFDFQATVDGMVGRCRLDLAFAAVPSASASDSMELDYSFSLPEGAVVDSMYLWIGETMVPAALKSSWTAWQIYSNIVGYRHDPALLTNYGGTAYDLRIFPFNQKETRRVRICYSLPVSLSADRLKFPIPLDMTGTGPLEVGSVSVNVAFPGRATQELSLLSADSSAWKIANTGTGASTVTYTGQGQSFAVPVSVAIADAAFSRDGVSVHFENTTAGETHFMALLNPRKALGLSGLRKKRKLLVFWNLVATEFQYQQNDKGNYGISGVDYAYYTYSNGGSADARGLLAFLDQNLLSTDEINLWVNDCKLSSFQAHLKPYDVAARGSLERFLGAISTQSASGGCPSPQDLVGAGLKSLNGEDSLDILIIDPNSISSQWDTTFTDKRDPAAILSALPKSSTVYTLAESYVPGPFVKPTATTLLYQAMSRSTNGVMVAATYYSLQESLNSVTPYFSPRIYPSSINLSGTQDGYVYDLSGLPPNIVFLDQSLVLMGKLRFPGSPPPVPQSHGAPAGSGAGADSLVIRLSGNTLGQEIIWRKSVPVLVSNATVPGLAKLWAASKVNALLGNAYYSPQIWQDALDISLSYRILTPVTALLALEPGRFDSTWYRDEAPTNSPGTTTRLARQKSADRSSSLGMDLKVESGFLNLTLRGLSANPGDASPALKIYDLRGKLILDLSAQIRKGEQTLRCSIQGLAKGSYVVRLTLGKKVSSREFRVK